ncbi:M56 family metallopeptidase [Dactylosporangium sp. NPDC051484]|uniref:M56 family metallopeptidase n=1 Tax=Dactylosporangium sp. NPDC051484 TaxID=3154942 RepID=UPI00344C2355
MSPLLLVAFAAALALLGAPRLAAAGWVVRSPRLGVAAWLALSAAILLSGLLAGLSLLLYWDCAHDLVDGVWHVCLDALLGRHNGTARLAAFAGLAALLLIGARMLYSAGRLYAAHRTTRSRLRLLVRLTTGPSPLPGATVVAHPEPAAYLVPGPLLPGRHADIVVTTAAIDRLAATELSAVLAHERGHHAGRHYAATRWMRMLAQAFPWARCFRLGRQQVDRLVELCADDTAARSAARIDLARALVAMAGPATSGRAGDAPLAMHGGDALERLHRLLAPPAPLGAPARTAIAATCGLLPVTPMALAVVERTVAWASFAGL